jgi:Glycosyltransferase like family 2
MSVKLVLEAFGLYTPAIILLFLLQQALLDQGCPYGPSTAFAVLFVFRYYRTLLQALLWYTLPIITRMKKAQKDSVHAAARSLARDATVILPTTGPFTTESVVECIQNLIANRPKRFILSVPFAQTKREALAGLALMGLVPGKTSGGDDGTLNGVPVRVVVAAAANRRKQLIAALKNVGTEDKSEVFVIPDDHTFVPAGYLDNIMEPFAASANVGIAGSTFRVRRRSTQTWLAAFFNVLGCLYLERQAFANTTTFLIDGGVSVIAGRMMAIRGAILLDPAFQRHFVNEYCFFGLVGPLHTDDDNCITRWIFRRGWDVAYLNDTASTVETDLGEYPKFLKQCLRWLRTTWRSNPCSLFTDGTVWFRQPWCVYAVHLTSLVSFAFLYDPAIILVLRTAVQGVDNGDLAIWALVAWIMLSKVVKTAGWWIRHPKDLVFLPATIAFAYFHSLIKLWALITFWDRSWSGRVNVE